MGTARHHCVGFAHPLSKVHVLEQPLWRFILLACVNCQLKHKSCITIIITSKFTICGKRQTKRDTDRERDRHTDTDRETDRPGQVYDVVYPRVWRGCVAKYQPRMRDSLEQTWHSRAPSQTAPPTRIHWHICTHTHKHAHTHPHTRTHTYTHAHPHTHWVSSSLAANICSFCLKPRGEWVSE